MFGRKKETEKPRRFECLVTVHLTNATSFVALQAGNAADEESFSGWVISLIENSGRMGAWDGKRTYYPPSMIKKITRGPIQEVPLQ